MSQPEIQVLIDRGPAQRDDLPAPSQLVQFARLALGELSCELNIRVVSAAESQRLNAQFRAKHRPTNVLSFPAELPPDWPINILGDLALCADVIAREAQEQAKSPQAHWAHMVIHGCLHLLGFDHQSDADAATMEAREIALLAELGFANPYEIIDDSSQANWSNNTRT